MKLWKKFVSVIVIATLVIQLLPAQFLIALSAPENESVPAEKIFEALKKEQIYVRYFKTPGLDNSLRISIGTDEEMDTLFRFLEAYLPNA